MVRRWKPKIVFLMETKSKVKRMEKIKNRIGFTNGLIVPSRGRSDGMALFWTREVNLDTNNYSGNHIDAIVREIECNFKWRITGFYGHPEHTEGMSLSASLLSCTVSFNSHGFAWETLMKYFQ